MRYSRYFAMLYLSRVIYKLLLYLVLLYVVWIKIWLFKQSIQLVWLSQWHKDCIKSCCIHDIEVLAHNTSLTQPLQPGQESERLYVYVGGIDFNSISMILSLEFGQCSTFLFFHLIDEIRLYNSINIIIYLRCLLTIDNYIVMLLWLDEMFAW